MRRQILFAAAPVALTAAFAAVYFLFGRGPGVLFSEELRNAADEWTAFADDIRKRFPDLPHAQESAKTYADLAKSVVQYDAEIARQRISHDERVTRLKVYFIEEIRKMGSAPPSIDLNDPAVEPYATYIIEHRPTSLGDLLGLNHRIEK